MPFNDFYADTKTGELGVKRKSMLQNCLLQKDILGKVVFTNAELPHISTTYGAKTKISEPVNIYYDASEDIKKRKKYETRDYIALNKSQIRQQVPSQNMCAYKRIMAGVAPKECSEETKATVLPALVHGVKTANGHDMTEIIQNYYGNQWYERNKKRQAIEDELTGRMKRRSDICQTRAQVLREYKLMKDKTNKFDYKKLRLPILLIVVTLSATYVPETARGFFDGTWLPWVTSIYKGHTQLTVQTPLNYTFSVLLNYYDKSNNLNELSGEDFKNGRPERTMRTFIIIHGFQDQATDIGWATKMKDALRQRIKNSNYILIDWSKGAQTYNYYDAADRTKSVGTAIGELLIDRQNAETINSGNDFIKTIHCIGHSLGAHICGFISKEIKKISSGKYKFRRITGLDPAGPSFKDQNGMDRLSSTDAGLVDTLMSTTSFGISLPIGHLNFYLNNLATQPGCWLDKRYAEKLLGCGHKFAVNFFIDTIEKYEICAPVKNCTWAFNTDKCERKSCPLIESIRMCPQAGFFADSFWQFDKFNDWPSTYSYQTNKKAPYCANTISTK
ncbi:hypothetical protein SNEBB_007546 [Seison nebaliae]|nr:hypothetical protein SNEBB_007546 [Seison nebaliae]